MHKPRRHSNTRPSFAPFRFIVRDGRGTGNNNTGQPIAEYAVPTCNDNRNNKPKPIAINKMPYHIHIFTGNRGAASQNENGFRGGN
ncbi:MAG: hypothetical protein KJ607_00945, partial [Bacteroidetes bacterium]|nr:hypothetical protein [Bacteroidota bacterium]